MIIQQLKGDRKCRQSGSNEWLSVDVPGEVHTDLLAAGKIPDPFVADNEYKVLWAAEVNLEYKTSFKLETKILAHEYIFLVAEGLGALARVQINGEMLQSGRDSVIV